MRLPVVLFIIGFLMLTGGILLAIAFPPATTWQPNSEVLANEESLTVSPGWTSQSQSLIDQVITVYPPYETYNYRSALGPFIFEEAKNFIINGTAIEQSSPQRSFNLYVFDSVNFNLWEAGSTYTAYYETQGQTSVNFSVAIEDAVPSMFFFVVEEYAAGVKPVVSVRATAYWTGKASIVNSSKYYTNWTIIIEESKDFVLEGNASEAYGKKFNFYILDSNNYGNLISGTTYTPYFEEKETTSTSFSIPLTPNQITSPIYFVAENPLLDTSETVRFSATLKWNEKATMATTISGLLVGGIIAFLGIIVIIIAGAAHLVLKPKEKTPAPPAPPVPPAQTSKT